MRSSARRDGVSQEGAQAEAGDPKLARQGSEGTEAEQGGGEGRGQEGGPKLVNRSGGRAWPSARKGLRASVTRA